MSSPVSAFRMCSSIDRDELILMGCRVRRRVRFQSRVVPVYVVTPRAITIDPPTRCELIFSQYKEQQYLALQQQLTTIP
jgi:hypothetical protein